MSYDNYSVIDCDGHIVESAPEMAGFMSARISRCRNDKRSWLRTRGDSFGSSRLLKKTPMVGCADHLAEIVPVFRARTNTRHEHE